MKAGHRDNSPREELSSKSDVGEYTFNQPWAVLRRTIREELSVCFNKVGEYDQPRAVVPCYTAVREALSVKNNV